MAVVYLVAVAVGVRVEQQRACRWVLRCEHHELRRKMALAHLLELRNERGRLSRLVMMIIVWRFVMSCRLGRLLSLLLRLDYDFGCGESQLLDDLFTFLH